MSEIALDYVGLAQQTGNQQEDDSRLLTGLFTALQSIGEGVIVTDLDGMVEFLNAAAEDLTGVKTDSAKRQPLQKILKLRERFGTPIRHDLASLAIISGTPVALGKDILLVTPGGVSRQIEGEISVRLSAGVPTGTVVTFRDVTARNLEELQRLEHQKLSAVSHLAGAVAHELNNFLTVVLGHSEAIEDLYPDSAPLHASTAEIRRVTSGIAIITRQLTTLSRREVLNPQALEPNLLIEGLVPTFHKILPPSVDLRITLAPNVGNIFADRAQMEEAITNLVQHCRTRLPEGGSLTISTGMVVVDSNLPAQHLRRYIRLVIEDSGPSLHGEAVEELFEPSWDNNPARPSGLGLFTVRNMIGAANGHLSIESAFPAGVKFIMLFPEREVEVVPDERKETLPAPQKNRTVLLVEDNDAIRILLRNAFEKRGFCVIEARDGEEALLQSDLQADPIDLLISDVVMPLMDGPTLARKLTEQRPAMKVILVSGCPVDPSAVRELVAAGAQFIPKPFTQRDLLAQAEKTLAGSRDSVS